MRERIVSEAFRLISAKGEKAMSMRELAQACDVNVAAIYYYFASKADLFRAVIEERSYRQNLHEMPHLIAEGPKVALSEIIVAVWQGVAMEERVWRMLLGESLRQSEAATSEAIEILQVAEGEVKGVVDAVFPAWGPERRTVAATVVLNEVFAALLEQIYRPGRDLEAIRERAAGIAGLVASAYDAETAAATRG